MSTEGSASRRRLVATSTLGAGVVLVVALFAIVNYFGWKYYQRFDWTASRIYTLSEKSKNVLAELDRDIEAVAFMRPGDELYGPVMELLSRYEAGSPRITVREVDPDKNLLEARRLVEQYEIQRLNVIVFDSGEERRIVETADLADYDYSGMQFGGAPEMTAFKGEQAFTGALLELQESRKPKVLFTTGHGEAGLDDFSPAGLSQAAEFLGQDNFEIEEWASLGQPQVPEGTDLVVIAGPRASFVEPELQVLGRFAESGGRLLVLLDPSLSPGQGLIDTGLGPWLAGYGVEVGEDIVVDPANPLPFFGAETIFVSSFAEQPITRPLRQAQVPVIFALARSVGAGTGVDGLDAIELLHTSAEGWGESDLSRLQAVEKGEGDREGPVSLGVAVEGTGGQGAPPAAGEDPAPAPRLRLVVFGDSDFATNAQLASAGNSILLANAVNWLIQRESLLAIPPKEPEKVRLSLTGAQMARITWLVLAILPGLAIGLGVATHLRRRS